MFTKRIALAAALTGLAASLPAQIVIRRAGGSEQAELRRQVPAQAEGPHDLLFYKAFYLYRGANRFNEAIELFRKFLEKAPDSPLAPVAARNTLNLLYRTNRVDEANEFRERYEKLLARGPRRARGDRARRDREGRGDRPRVDRPRAGGRARPPRARRGDPAGRLQMIERRLAQLERNLKKAREEGSEEEVERLERRLENLKRAYEEIKRRIAEGGPMPEGRRRPREGRGPAGRGRFGRRMRPLTEMSKDELQEHVERMGQMIERFAARLEDMGQEERAEQLVKSFKKYKSLIEAGKLEEAMELRRTMFGRRRRR